MLIFPYHIYLLSQILKNTVSKHHGFCSMHSVCLALCAVLFDQQFLYLPSIFISIKWSLQILQFTWFTYTYLHHHIFNIWHTNWLLNLFIYLCTVWTSNRDGLGMWCIWGRRGGRIGSWWGNWRERDQWGDLGVDGWIILGWIPRRWDVGMWTGMGWPRIGTGGGRLWVR